MLYPHLSNIAIMVKGVYYRCIIGGISKSEVIYLLANYLLDDGGYM